MTDGLVVVQAAPSLSTAAVRFRTAMWAVVAVGVVVAVAAPIFVAILQSAGILRHGQYYPDPWAWPTVFTVALAVTVSLNALIWFRVIRMIDGEPSRGRRAAFVIAAVILLAIGSFVVVFVLALAGIGVYFQLPVSY